jgi:hypothetical protein
MRRLDDLLAEAGKLRRQIETAMKSRTSLPFWPERRKQRLPVSRDRRR